MIHHYHALCYRILLLLVVVINATVAFVITTSSCFHNRQFSTKLYAELILPNNDNNNINNNFNSVTEAELANQLASRSVDLPDEISSSFMQYALSIILGRVSWNKNICTHIVINVRCF
jgi:hypothetical protein